MHNKCLQFEIYAHKKLPNNKTVTQTHLSQPEH